MVKIVALTAVVFLVAGIAQASERMVIGNFTTGLNSEGVPNGWQLKEKAGRADVSIVNAGGVKAVQLRSRNTSFSLQRQVNAELKKFPILSWKWKVTKLPEGGDFRNSKTDDQAAQLFVAFNRRQMIVYLWDSTAPKGLIGEALGPPFMSIKVVVMRSAKQDAGKWLTESRNVYEDYRKLYGDTDRPPVVCGVRLQINTQHTKNSAESYFADLAFESGT
jgi:hypothetical protein